MAKETGTATDYDDLLTKLSTFLVANNWTVNADFIFNGNREVYFKGPDIPVGANIGNVYINIMRYTLSSTIFNWTIVGATSYESTSNFYDQPGATTISTVLSGNRPTYCLSDFAMDYWFFTNNRRFIVVAKVSTRYASMYAGLQLPYATNSEEPYPLYVSGSSGQGNKSYNTTDINNRTLTGISFPVSFSSAYRKSDGSWIFTEGNSTISCPHMWPLSFPNPTVGSGPVILWSVLNSNYPLVGLIFSDSINNRSSIPMYGELDGVYFLPGVNQASENTITIGSDTYIVFQSYEKITTLDFFAIKDE